MSDELKEFVLAEIFVTGADSPDEEKRLSDLLGHIEGIAEFTLSKNRIDLRYEPISVTRTEIRGKIESAGFGITEIESAAGSPIVDAIDVHPGEGADHTGSST